MVMYREVCPEGVQNKCPGGVWCRGFMSWGDTLILVISRGVQLYYGIAHSAAGAGINNSGTSGRMKQYGQYGPPFVYLPPWCSTKDGSFVAYMYMPAPASKHLPILLIN